MLTGRVGHLFAVGIIDRVESDLVVANTIFLGRRIGTESDDLFPGPPPRSEIHPEEIDAFNGMAGEAFPTEKSLEILKGVREHDIKHAFARLLSEDAVPKDWGGEQSDLFTTRLKVRGTRLSAAFLFKGPARFHPMTVADLGKNGDQIGRLASEPAELLVVQHCHRVTAQVRNLLRAHANQMAHQRAYCVIDGADTLRILRAYGQCGQTSKPHRRGLRRTRPNRLVTDLE
jgi:hypothetical protein